MRTKDVWIVTLFTVGLLLWIGVQGIILPKWEHDKEVDAERQLDPLTHDITQTMEYRSRYMGNSSNLSNLMGTLPLSQLRGTTELRSDIYKAEFHYRADSIDVEKKKLDSSLIYNAAAAFALIDNLNVISFAFEDRLFTAQRSSFERWYGTKCAAFTESKEFWMSRIQQPLSDEALVEKELNALFTVSKP